MTPMEAMIYAAAFALAMRDQPDHDAAAEQAWRAVCAFQISARDTRVHVYGLAAARDWTPEVTVRLAVGGME